MVCMTERWVGGGGRGGAENDGSAGFVPGKLLAVHVINWFVILVWKIASIACEKLDRMDLSVMAIRNWTQMKELAATVPRRAPSRGGEVNILFCTIQDGAA